MPSLRSCSVSPLRRTSTRPHDIGASRSKAEGELTLGLMSGENQKRYADLLSVGASLLAMDVNDNACCLGSLLAMDVNDNACCLEKYVAFEFIASRLAPTGGMRALCRSCRRLRSFDLDVALAFDLPPLSQRPQRGTEWRGKAFWFLFGV
jgi:hypothetical protein